MDRGMKVRGFAEKLTSNCSSFETCLQFIQRLIVNGSETLSGLNSASFSGDTTYSQPASVKEAL